MTIACASTFDDSRKSKEEKTGSEIIPAEHVPTTDILEASLATRHQTAEADPELLRWGILSGAAIRTINGSPVFPSIPDDRSVNSIVDAEDIAAIAAERLRTTWNVNNKEELKLALNKQIYHGFLNEYRNLLITLNTHDVLAENITAAWDPEIQQALIVEGTFSNSDILLLDLIRYFPESFDYSVFAASELSWLSVMIQWGMEAGYLNSHEGISVLEDIALILASQNWNFGLLAHSQMAFAMSRYANLNEHDYHTHLRNINIVVFELIESGLWDVSESSRLISQGRQLLEEGRQLPAYAEFITTAPDHSMMESPEILRTTLHCTLGQPVPDLYIYENDARLINALRIQDTDTITNLLHTREFWDSPVKGMWWTGHAVQYYPEILELFINLGYRIDGQGPYLNRSSLHIAALHNQPEAVKVLLRHGANIEAPSSAGETPLSIGIANRSTDAVKILLQSGANPNSGISNDRTPLGYSLREGHNEEAALLLEHGADPNLRSGWNWTNIMLAARFTDARVMKLMIAAGADPNQHVVGLEPTLHLAITQQDSEVLSLLIKAGANLELLAANNETALAYAVRTGEFEAVRILLEAGADPNARLMSGRTVLGHSLRNGLNDQALLLLHYGADPLIGQGTDWSPIMLASHYANAEVIQKLLEAGSDPNDYTADNAPNLHFAILHENFGILSMLITAGAHLEALSPSDEEIQSLNKDNTGFLSMLSTAGANLESPYDSGETALAYAVRTEKYEAVRILLEAGANPNARLKTGRTPLGQSLRNSLNDQALLLLHYGADPLIHQGTDWSHILLAARYGNAEIVQKLIDAGCDPNENIEGILPPLHLAVAQNSTAVLSTLITAGADLNIENQNGQTVMTYSILNNKIESVRSLLMAGDDPNRVHGFRTVLALSLLRHYKEISLLLLEHGAKPFYSSGDELPHIQLAIQFGDFDIVQHMVETWHNTSHQQNELTPLLQHAVASSDPEHLSPLLMALLIDERDTVRQHLINEGDPNAMLNGIPMIIYAALREDPSLLQLFLDKSVDLMRPDQFTGNPLAATLLGLLSIHGDRDIQVNIALHLMDSGTGILPIDRYPAQTALLLYHNVKKGFRRDDIFASAQERGYSTASRLHGMYQKENIIDYWSDSRNVQYELHYPTTIPRHGTSNFKMVFSANGIEIKELWYFSEYAPGGRRIPIKDNTASIPVLHYASYETTTEVYHDQGKVYLVTEEGVYTDSLSYELQVIPPQSEGRW